MMFKTILSHKIYKISVHIKVKYKINNKNIKINLILICKIEISQGNYLINNYF